MEVTGKRLETEASSSQNEAKLCESCKLENLSTPANGVCRECNEQMCTTCFKHHLKGKFCRSHVLLTLEEFSSLSLGSGSRDVTKCEKHDSETIKFYCRSHDVVGCGDCIVLEHTSCKPEYIKDLEKTFVDGDMYKAIVQRIESLEKKNVDNRKEIEKSKDEVERMNENALKEIRQFRTEINKCLDEAEANILSQLQKWTQENRKTLDKIENDLHAFTSEFDTVKQMINTQPHCDNVLFINAVNSKSKLSDIEKLYENKIRIKDGMLEKFEFVRNEHMSGLLKSAEPLGKLKTDARKEMKRKQFFVGARVRRGPDWHHGNQDGSGLGTLVKFVFNGIAKVQWDNGLISSHCVGHNNKYEIEKV